MNSDEINKAYYELAYRLFIHGIKDPTLKNSIVGIFGDFLRNDIALSTFNVDGNYITIDKLQIMISAGLDDKLFTRQIGNLNYKLN